MGKLESDGTCSGSTWTQDGVTYKDYVVQEHLTITIDEFTANEVDGQYILPLGKLTPAKDNNGYDPEIGAWFHREASRVKKHIFIGECL